MEDVTGFNQKSSMYDGEKLIEAGMKRLRQKYSENVCEIIRLMLKFYEEERPTFLELGKLIQAGDAKAGFLPKTIDPNLVASLPS